MNDFIDQVRALTRDAWAAPWTFEWLPGSLYDAEGDSVAHGSATGDLECTQENGEFIAAARTMLPAAVEALARVRELHRPVESQWGDQACAECSNGWDLEVIWPCATIKAIGEAVI